MATYKFGRWYYTGHDDQIIEQCLREALAHDRTQLSALEQAASILGAPQKSVFNRMQNSGVMKKINEELELSIASKEYE